MTEQRRTAPRLVWLALGLAMLAAVLLVVPGTSTTPSSTSAKTFAGTGSTVVSVQDTPGQPDHSNGSVTPGTSINYSSDTKGPATNLSHRPSELTSTHSFTISVGSVSGLYPGKLNRLPLLFRNPQTVPISVRTATTTATGPADCPVSTSLILWTRAFIGRVIVPAHGSKAKSIRFGMLKTAADGCQDAKFTITVTATAVRA